jgi:tellurite resistance protein TerC
MNDTMNKTLKHARMVAVAVIGTTAVLIGIAMLVLPGPGVLVIIGGLALLGTEFLWARRLMRKVKRTARNIKEGIQGSGKKAPDGDGSTSEGQP